MRSLSIPLLLPKENSSTTGLHQKKKWSKFYDEAFEESQAMVLKIFHRTNNLSDLTNHPELLVEEKILSTMRYMQRPSVSANDFSILSGTNTSSAIKLHDPDLAGPALQYIKRTLNLKLFPWLCRDSCSPTLEEIHAATYAVSAIIADQKTKTAMRNRPSRSQEKDLRDALIRIGYREIPVKAVKSLDDFPAPMELFSSETAAAGAKADVAFGLPDGRLMAIECKSSNSEVNSYKRLNHEVTDKCTKWRQAFGDHVVGACVLQGVFKPGNLVDAQQEQVSIFWSHDIDTLLKFIEAVAHQTSS